MTQNPDTAAQADQVVDPLPPGDTAQARADESSDTGDKAEPAKAGEDEHSGNQEAAKWRKRLRDTETQRDELAEKVTALQRDLVEHAITGHKVEPAAVWAVTELADLLDDTGGVDAAKVSAAVETAKTTLGIEHGLYVPEEGYQPEHPSGRSSFAEAFAPRKR